MSEMNEFTPELFELIDDEGNNKTFELVDCTEFNGEQYYAMIPAIEDDDFLNADLELVILKTIEENGEEILASIEDDSEYESVYNLFLQRMQDSLEDYDDFDSELC